MKVALVTTTINIPDVLQLYEEHAYTGFHDQHRIFVVEDLKTSHQVVPRWSVLSVEEQKKLPHTCSELIGWNCNQRRSIGFLEAVRWGADLIVTIDDDNIPLDAAYFTNFVGLFEPSLWHGLQVESDTSWVDVGRLFQPEFPSRGYPYQLPRPELSFSHVLGAKIGVGQGLVLGDPDVSAVTRLAQAPRAHVMSEVLRAGVVVAPGQWTVFNSQNTAFVRELVPAMFMWPGLGRDHDIFASLVCQRIMRDLGYLVHFGAPFAYQQRNAHDLVADLHAELVDYDNLLAFAGWLDQQIFADGWSVVEKMRALCERAPGLSWWPEQASKAGLAWCDDCERVGL